MKDCKITAVREHNIVYIIIVYESGARQCVGGFMLPTDKQWRLDMDLIDEVISAYKKRLKKLL